jgi:pantothenate synthetase
MVAIIAMRNSMLIMRAHGFTLFSRNNYFIKNHKYQACVIYANIMQNRNVKIRIQGSREFSNSCTYHRERSAM